ncbi:hypothetical protein BGZ98_009297 [Dissophora globulifera]|nr:hypothetical protein BGZ98_009297 [Dissophora globulifera]
MEYWTDKARIARQISLGLAYLHSKGIIHGDIKSLNVLLTKYKDCKICDFGSAHKTGEQGRGGTTAWMAPELFLSPPQYSHKSDVYALGMVMWEMASNGVRPYKEHTSDGIECCIINGRTEEIPENTPEEFASAIKKCWSYVANDRPDADQVLAGVEDVDVTHEKVEDEYDEEIKNDSGLRYLAMAARQGDPKACAKLGEFYHNGYGVPQNSAKALAFFQKGAELGNRKCQSNLGSIYYRGMGVPKDAAKGVEWYKKAADQGAVVAMSALGVAFYTGNGVSQDYLAATEWCLKAAEQNYFPAMQFMAACYGKGLGVSKDMSESRKWFIKAAEAGGPDSKRSLAKLYDEGQYPGGATEALKWRQKAIDQGEFSMKEYMKQHEFYD